jgi:hypothetical protein
MMRAIHKFSPKDLPIGIPYLSAHPPPIIQRIFVGAPSAILAECAYAST